MRMLSVITLLAWKTLWFLDTTKGRIGFSLLARTFKTILYTTLHRLIGLKLEISSGDLTLGIRVILVQLISLGIL